jgi:hypothetical protein
MNLVFRGAGIAPQTGLPVKFTLVVVAVVALVSQAGWRPTFRSRELPQMPLAKGERRPVVVELFTSEGCSSCPPADRLLAKLESEQPVPGAEIIALGWHVDYWNHLGWADRFSSSEFTERQYAYSQSLGTSGVYTPQMVVDGVTEFIGSDGSLARRTIAEAAQAPKAEVSVTLVAGPSGGEARLAVRVEKLGAAQAAGKVEVLLAVTENGLGSSVQRGENAGRRLEHRAVVHRLQRLGTLDANAGGVFSTEAAVALAREWRRENLRTVVYVQESRTRRIVGAAAVALSGN